MFFGVFSSTEVRSEEPPRLMWDVNRERSRGDVISSLLHDGSPVALHKQPIISTCDECAAQPWSTVVFTWKLWIRIHLTDSSTFLSMKNESSFLEWPSTVS